MGDEASDVEVAHAPVPDRRSGVARRERRHSVGVSRRALGAGGRGRRRRRGERLGDHGLGEGVLGRDPAARDGRRLLQLPDGRARPRARHVRRELRPVGEGQGEVRPGERLPGEPEHRPGLTYGCPAPLGAGHHPHVARILVTGMSGTGKSSALAELERRGHYVVDTDYGGWGDGVLWDEERMAALLAEADRRTLFVSGTVENQGRFYDRFDAVVLLSAPVDVLLERIRTRTTNPFGKSAEERKRILADLAEVEPLLRATATHELDATRPVEVVVAELAAIGEGVRRG